MRKLSITAGDRGPVLTKLKGKTLNRWFNAMGGKQKASVIKPILDAARKEQRVHWADKMLRQMMQGSFYIAFLDEKWFYTRSRRKKMKILPRHPNESEEDAAVPVEREVSRRHATKVMFLGVVAKPDDEHNFDGKICIKQVSEKKTYARSSHVSGIVDEYELNATIHQTWRNVVAAPNADGSNNGDAFSLTADEVIAKVCDHFNLSDDVKDNLALRYDYFTARGNKSVKSCIGSKKISDHQTQSPANTPPRQLTLNDLRLAVRRNAGDTYEHDCSCDSEFMLRVMDDVGRQIRESMSWVPRTTPIFLSMDNAGGHGTKEAVEKYTNDLQRNHKVTIVQQVPRSPETNMLDLGVWCALQSVVEKEHREKTKSDANALARTVDYAWHNRFGPEIMQKVYDRWEQVLKIIIKEKGDNARVDQFRGKKNLLTVEFLDPDADKDDESQNDNDEDDDEW